MQKAVRLFLCVCFLAVSTQAHAFFTLDFSGAGIGSTTYTNISSLALAGSGNVEQFTPGGAGQIEVGNTFTQTAIGTDFVKAYGFYDSVLNFVSPMLGSDKLSLRVLDGQLDGTITAAGVVGTSTIFEYDYVPGDIVQFVYKDGANPEVIIADIKVLEGNGSNSLNDFIGSGTGTFNLLGKMTVNVDNLIYVNGHDVFDFPLTTIALAAYDGHINLGAATDITATSFKQQVKGIGGEMTIYATPEPATMTLLGIGALGAAFLRRRNRRSN